MSRLKRSKHGPEWYIQQRLIAYLRDRGWLVEISHGNLYQKGWPDLFIHHPKWGSRWIDVKNPERYNFTRDQRWKWPLWDQFGVGIWILTDATQEEYDKLFRPPNWRDYWKDSWKLPTEAEIDEMIDNLEDPDASDQT